MLHLAIAFPLILCSLRPIIFHYRGYDGRRKKFLDSVRYPAINDVAFPIMDDTIPNLLLLLSLPDVLALLSLIH